MFATLHTLTKNKGAFSVRWTALLVIITFLQVGPSTACTVHALHVSLPWRYAHHLLLPVQMFRVLFNSTNGWIISHDNW